MTHKPTLLENFIWRFRRIMTGKAESKKSEIIDMTDLLLSLGSAATH